MPGQRSRIDGRKVDTRTHPTGATGGRPREANERIGLVAVIRKQTSPTADGGAAPLGSGAEKPPASRLLTAGARGAERMAQAAGVDRALSQAVEEAIVRALRSPAVIRAIERTVESHAVTAERSSDEIAQIVKRVLESDAAGQVWEEFLASEQAQMLVERVAGAPELREAIAAQGAGLITDIGVRLTKITEELDDALERRVRPRSHEAEFNQAGLATRLVAAAIDLGLLFLAYSLASGVIASIVSAVFGKQLSLAAVIVIAVVGVIVGGGIFATFWLVSGRIVFMPPPCRAVPRDASSRARTPPRRGRASPPGTSWP